MERLADGHMTFHSSFTLDKCRQAWPLDLSIAVPALSWLPEQPAETQGGTMSQKNRTASALDPIALYA